MREVSMGISWRCPLLQIGICSFMSSGVCQEAVIAAGCPGRIDPVGKWLPLRRGEGKEENWWWNRQGPWTTPHWLKGTNYSGLVCQIHLVWIQIYALYDLKRNSLNSNIMDWVYVNSEVTERTGNTGFKRERFVWQMESCGKARF